MLKYNFETKKIEPFKYSVKYRRNGSTVTEYYNTLEEIAVSTSHIVNKDEIEVVEIKLSEEELARLEVFNTLAIEYKQNYLYQANNYVKFATCISKDPVLAELVTKCREANIRYLVGRLSGSLKAIRDEKINGGVTVFGVVFDSDSFTEGILSSIRLTKLELKMDGKTDDELRLIKTQWKLQDNSFKEFNMLELCDVHQVVLDNKQISHLTEAEVHKYLLSLDVDDLCRFEANSKYYNASTAVDGDVVVRDYTDLRAIFEDAFAQVSQAYFAGRV